MNQLAQELNKTLEGTAALELLSELGKRFYFPKGIVAQTMEAAEHAYKFVATVGEAKNKKKPVHLSVIRNFIPGLDPDEIFPYAPTPGIKEFRLLWKEHMIKKNPDLKVKKTSFPLVMPGITTGISIIADMFVDPGDVILIPDLFWGNYRLILEGKKLGTIVTFPFFESNNKLNLKAFEQAIEQNTSRGKLIILLNFPNNPTGYAPLKDEILPLTRVLEKAAGTGLKILMIIDDSYFGLFYEDTIYPQSIFTPLANIHPNILSVKLDGSTKEDFAWGFRVACLTYGGKGLSEEQYTALEQKTKGVMRSTFSNSSKLGQSLLIRALKSTIYQNEKAENIKLLKAKYEKVKAILDHAGNNSLLKPLPFNSGYFMCFELTKGSAEKLRHYLLYEKGIGTISIEDRYLRIAYANVELENIEELYEELFKAAEAVAG
ncbi:MAG: aminotransferase class I/II-fold pyridoxal phosphate-dependent enzyme [Spirochaetales bacterium]|nr:aminotransferase class I/II-fold pyridoxal phosphate-dependent enzyme [Spirochaetales bacterium]